MNLEQIYHFLPGCQCWKTDSFSDTVCNCVDQAQAGTPVKVRSVLQERASGDATPLPYYLPHHVVLLPGGARDEKDRAICYASSIWYHVSRSASSVR
jgi:hypothetical protein